LDNQYVKVKYILLMLNTYSFISVLLIYVLFLLTYYSEYVLEFNIRTLLNILKFNIPTLLNVLEFDIRTSSTLTKVLISNLSTLSKVHISHLSTYLE
jgi:hypothetical protein